MIDTLAEQRPYSLCLRELPDHPFTVVSIYSLSALADRYRRIGCEKGGMENGMCCTDGLCLSVHRMKFKYGYVKYVVWL